MDFPLAEALESVRATRCGVMAVYCVAIYEWLDTLPTEVELIYPSHWNSIKVAYFLCRYYLLLLWPLVVFAYVGDHSAETCDKLTLPVNILLLPTQLFAPGVMLMRAYAFTGRSLRILAILLFFFAGLVGVSIYNFGMSGIPLPYTTYEILGGTGCYPDYTRPHAETRLLLSLGGSTAMDFLSLSVILIYCLRIWSTRGSLGRLFVNQGLGAFFSILAVNGVALGTYFSPKSFHNGVGLPYILVIPNLVACRLILDLRRRALPTETEILRQHSHLIGEALANTDIWGGDPNTNS